MTNRKFMRSLDVFDTALLRRTYLPDDIFKLVEEKVGKNFYEKRVEAERKAREKKRFYGIKDIYKFLPEFDMEVEIETERENIYPNKELLNEVYDYRNTVFISDMYLPSKVIEEFLEDAGYENPRVFVSCEMKACKADGSLFKKAQEHLGLTISQHYGDNYAADIEGAKRAGIKNVVFRPALHNKDYNLPKVRNTFLKKYLAVVEDECSSSLNKLALYYAPIIFEFTKWILNQRQAGQKIYFLSRDMYMPYLIARDIFEADDIYYLKVSRRSLACLGLKSRNNEVKRKLSFIFTADEIKKKRTQDDFETLRYLKKFDIADNDIIADIGYAGTIQAIIDNALRINTQGLYMQVSSNVIEGIKTKMFLKRLAIHYCLMVEFVFGSNEDSVEGYKNLRPVYVKDNQERKELAQEIIGTIMSIAQNFYYDNFIAGKGFDVFDLEQILIHQQYYLSDDLIKIYNKKIYSNRERKESIIGYDREEIMQGNLRDLYNRSYCQPLFKMLLERDSELKHLSRLLR